VVEDNGPGFPPEVLSGVLTTSDASKHFGLVLIAASVEAHGGVLELTNAITGGARVTLRFPFPTTSDATEAVQSPQPTSRGQSIVDLKQLARATIG